MLSAGHTSACATAQCAAPGELMNPLIEPDVTPVARLTKRSTMKLPLAFANRPVPPVIALISTM